MKKQLLIALIIGFGIFSYSEAHADFEFVETVLSALENVQKKYQVIQEQYQKIESQANALRQGPLGVLDSVSSKLNFEKIPVQALPIISENIGSVQGLEKAIQKGTMANVGTANQIQTSIANEQNNADIMREDVSRLYAYAFTLRTNMAKNRQEEDDDSPATLSNNRATKQMIEKETMETARHLSNILDMQSALEELQRRIKASDLRVPAQKSDDEDEGEQQ